MENIQETSFKHYNEKIWKKVDGTEMVADGYSFRGKRVFKKAWDGLKNHFVKGIPHKKDGIKYEALDVREIGAGMEADVEITEKGDRGIAKLKLYGQNTRKENSITISKSKKGDHKHITALAEKIIKPLMNSYIDESNCSERIEEEKEFECNFCDKTSHSLPELKGQKFTAINRINSAKLLQTKENPKKNLYRMWKNFYKMRKHLTSLVSMSLY